MNKTLAKYKIGLAVLAVFVLGLLVYVLLQARGAKADDATTKSATSIADKLNSYMDNASSIPQNLAAANITNLPSTISYQKLSSERYKFCVTYQTNSSGVDSSSLVQDVVSRGLGDSSSTYTGDSSYEASALYFDGTHHKGQNCQTIKPYMYAADSYTNTQQDSGYSTESNPYTICKVGYNYSWAALRVTTLTPAAGSTNATVTVASVPAQTFKIDPKVTVFDSTCNPLALSDIAAGDMIDLYFSPYGAPITTIVKE